MKLRSSRYVLLMLFLLLAIAHPAAAQSSATIVKRLTELETKFASLLERANALEKENAAQAVKITSLETQLAAIGGDETGQNTAIAALQSGLAQETAARQSGDDTTLNSARTYADSTSSSILSQAKSYTDGKVNPVADKVTHFTRSGNDVYITGANIHIRNGLGSTFYGGVNGLGNLIIGYNELRDNGNARTGSHNLLLGVGLNYTKNGAILTGINNSSENHFASVLGGTGNLASGYYSVVVGGYNNVASGHWSTILGGRDRLAQNQLDHLP